MSIAFSKSFFKENRASAVLAGAWLLMQIFLYLKNGIVLSGEPEKYISQAKFLVNQGSVSNSSFLLYYLEIFLIALSMKLHSGYIVVVFAHLLLNGYAMARFYSFTRRNFLPSTAFLATLFLILNYPFQEFNTILQTESVFYSLGIIISTYVLSLTSLTIRSVSLTLMLLLVLSITRPTGMLFIPAVMLYIFFRFFPTIPFWWKVISVAGGGVLFLLLVNSAIGIGGELDFMLPFRDERIICGVPTLPHFIPIKESAEGNSLYGLLYYITHNTGQFIRLAGLRTLAFFGMVRSYYSLGHNIYLAVVFYFLYVLVLAALRTWIKKFPLELFYFATLIFLMWLPVVISCDDWHNRFFLAVLPYLILLGLPSWEKLSNKKPQ